LTEEHGKSALDDTPLRAAAIASALKYLKENNEQYETVAINTESMHALERTLCPFFTERDPEPRDEEGMNSSEAPPVGGSSPQGTRDTVLRTPCVPREQPLPPADGQPTTTDDVESALRDEQPRCIQRNRLNPAWVADTESPHVFVVGDNEHNTLRSLALAAFRGKNRPSNSEPGHGAPRVIDRGSLTFVNASEVLSMNEKAFPTRFHLGTGGPSFERTKKVSENELITHLLRLYHRRFATNAQLLYYSHCMIQRRSVNGVTATLSESATLQDVLTRRFQALEEGEAHSVDLTKTLETCVEKLTPQFSTIKGSPGFWRHESRKLLSTVCCPIMQKPTFFMTLSAADTFWIDFMANALPEKTDGEIAGMTKTQRNDILAENPDLAVSHFYHRWTALWDEIINGDSKPLGHVEDFYWRIEFQARGSPHVHMMLWIKDAPECSGLSDGPLPNVLREFIDFKVSTNISPAMAELDMSSLRHPCTVRTPVATPGDKYFDAHVQSLARVAQVHECTSYCSDTKRRTACRFGFPQELQHESVVQTVFRNNKTKKVISTQRNHPRVNAYNPSILGCWAGNMDIQCLVDAYGAAVYTASYVCKHEKNKNSSRTLYKLSKNASSLSVKQQSRKVMMGVLNSREVSMQEALWTRSDRSLCRSSREVLTVPALHLQLKNPGERDEDEIQNAFVRPDGTTLATNKHIRFYEDRPTSREGLSLFEWQTDFTLTTRKKDLHQSLKMLGRRGQNGSYRYATKRSRRAVVSIRYRLDPSHADTFAKGLLFLHTPWRSLSQILPEGTTAQAHLQSIRTSSDQTSAEHPRSMLEHYKGLHTMSSALEAQKEMDTALAADRQDVDLMPGAGESDDESTWGSESNDDDEEQDRADGENNSNLPAFEQRRMIGRKLMNKHHNQTQLARESVKRTAEIIKCRGDAEEGLETNDAAALEDTARRTLEDRVISFNPEQLLVFREFEKDLRRGLPSKRVVLVGPGGTGKSYLIDTVTMKIQQSLGPSQDQESGTTRGSRHTLLVKTAFTGVAASNIGGITLHSALECAGRSLLTDMTEATFVRLQRDWRSVKVLVIDEISFVSAANLNTISQRLGRVFPSKSHLTFGGLHVLMCGDPFQ